MKSVIAAVVLAVPGVCAAEIYKWVDENGQTHYGEQPQGQSSEQVHVPQYEGGAAQPVPDERQRLERVKKWVDARQKERERAKQEQDELREKRAKKKQKCDDLRRELRDMEIGGVQWYRLDEAGDRRFYSDEEIEARKVQMRETLRKNCD
jgi:hypothetical protein